MNRSYNKRKFFMRRSSFRLVALYVCCLWLGGNLAEAALPAPPQIPDYQDGGGATVSAGPAAPSGKQEEVESGQAATPTSAPAEQQAVPASPQSEKPGLPVTPPSAPTVQQVSPPSPPSAPSPAAAPANAQNIDSTPASGGLPASPPVPDSRKQEAAGSGQSAMPPPAPAAQPDQPQPPPANQDIPGMVADFFSNPTSAEEAMKLFRTADSRRNKMDKDYQALHRLLWYAMQLGAADAALTYGRLFDPLEPQWWTVKKDAERALAFYQSVALQNQEAQTAMKRLRDSMNSAMPKR